MRQFRVHSFAKATPGANDTTLASQFAYRLYYSASNNITTRAQVLSNGTLLQIRLPNSIDYQNELIDPDEFFFQTNSTGNLYFNLAVISPEGGMSVYEPVEFHISDPDAFTMLVNTENTGVSDNNQFQLTGAEGTYTARWDGNEQQFTGEQTLTFSAPGQHTIEIVGGLESIRYSTGGDRAKILEIKNWGVIKWQTMLNAFLGAANLDVTATDTPDLSEVTSMAGMFNGCGSLVGNESISNWTIPAGDISMNSMFNETPGFNIDISGWDFSTKRFFSNLLRSSGYNHDMSGIGLAPNLTTIEGIFRDSAMSAENYSRFLIGAANQVFANEAPYGVNMQNQQGMIYDGTVYDIAGEFNNAVDAVAYLTGLVADWTITEHTDWSEPPVPGNNGAITFTDVETDKFTANWAEAVDSNYTHAQLTYKVYSSDTGNIDTVAKAELNGTLETSALGITSYEFTGLQPETGKFVSVVVVNSDGVKALYPMVNVTTNEDNTITQSVTIESLNEDSDGVWVGYNELDEENEWYEVLVYDDNVYEEIFDVFNDNPALIEGLIQDTKYFFRVRARNIDGPGPWGPVQSRTMNEYGEFTESWQFKTVAQ